MIFLLIVNESKEIQKEIDELNGDFNAVFIKYRQIKQKISNRHDKQYEIDSKILKIVMDTSND